MLCGHRVLCRWIASRIYALTNQTHADPQKIWWSSRYIMCISIYIYLSLSLPLSLSLFLSLSLSLSLSISLSLPFSLSLSLSLSSLAVFVEIACGLHILEDNKAFRDPHWQKIFFAQPLHGSRLREHLQSQIM